MTNAELPILLGKELRQLGRNRAAMLSATLLPALILLLAPVQVIVGSRATGGQDLQQLHALPLPGLASLDSPSQLAVEFVYPLLFTIVGLILPSITTSYAVVTERERRTLELLVALPVTVTDVIASKLLAVVLLCLAIMLPLFAVNGTALVVFGLAAPASLAILLAPLLAALACSTGMSLLLTLLARDFRTANNLSGALLVPLLLVTLATLATVAGPGRALVLAAILLTVGAAALVIAFRWISFERYLD